VFLLFSLFLTVHVAAASCFVSLVIKESDNNVKLIVLDRLDTLRAKHGHVLDGLIMDVLQVLSRFIHFHYFILIVPDQQCSADMEVRRKAMSIVLSLTSSRNVEEVVVFLKKQLQKTQEADFDKVGTFYLIRELCCDAQAFLLHLGSGISPIAHPVYPRHCY
jgi:coatomer subunit beta